MKKIGIRQAAEMAGVPVITVAYVMTGNGRISAETRNLVLRTADELGVIRNDSAARIPETAPGTVVAAQPATQWCGPANSLAEVEARKALACFVLRRSPVGRADR